MRISYEDHIKGRTVIDASGRSVGAVDALYLDSESLATGLKVSGVRIRLHAEVADELGVPRGMFHPAVVDIPATALQALGDAVILSDRIASLVLPQAPDTATTH